MFNAINALDECEYQMEIIHDLLSETQKVIDEFCLHDFSNFPSWIGVVDGKIERKLFTRLQTAIHRWTDALIKKEKKRMRLKVNRWKEEIRRKRTFSLFTFRKLF